ncbi:MAG: hypothetical protein IAE91_02765 [Ignavibacteriaceae bacterium]|nr:hypothetical protein [Ignavibacteriaceae bacterium]
MSKGNDAKKGTKKQPAKSLKEKQADKRDKKSSLTNPGLLPITPADKTPKSKK